MTSGSSETGHVTGTKDKDYNVIWFTEVCLSNVLRLQTYVQDAEREGDSELADFFRKAQGESTKGRSGRVVSLRPGVPDRARAVVWGLGCTGIDAGVLR